MKYTILSLVLISLLSCQSPEYIVYEGFIQGTTFRIVYQNKNNYNDTILSLLKHFDATLSLYQENSIISRINRNDTSVILNDLFIDFYNKSRIIFEKSDGYFDITVAPLVDAWGFGPSETVNSDKHRIDSLLNIVGMDKIRMVNNQIVKSDPRIRLDGNAIAQGQSVDYISDFLELNGTQNYLVEIGGEVRSKGKNNKGEQWKIGIDKPVEGNDLNQRELQTILNITGKSLATSGNYRKFHLIDGIKYSHTINPKTGYPAKDRLLSATIVADECSIADGYATACMVVGLEKAKKLILELNGLDAYFIYSDDKGNLKIYYTPGFEKYIYK